MAKGIYWRWKSHPQAACHLNGVKRKWRRKAHFCFFGRAPGFTFTMDGIFNLPAHSLVSSRDHSAFHHRLLIQTCTEHYSELQAINWILHFSSMQTDLGTKSVVFVTLHDHMVQDPLELACRKIMESFGGTILRSRPKMD